MFAITNTISRLRVPNDKENDHSRDLAQKKRTKVK
jgi:hypothetical protein